MSRAKIQAASPEHEVAYQDLVALVRKHEATMTPIELLAIAANMLGKLVALQDQRVTTPELAMEVVATNIQRGNQEVLEQLAKSEGRA